MLFNILITAIFFLSSVIISAESSKISEEKPKTYVDKPILSHKSLKHKIWEKLKAFYYTNGLIEIFTHQDIIAFSMAVLYHLTTWITHLLSMFM